MKNNKNKRIKKFKEIEEPVKTEVTEETEETEETDETEEPEVTEVTKVTEPTEEPEEPEETELTEVTDANVETELTEDPEVTEVTEATEEPEETEVTEEPEETEETEVTEEPEEPEVTEVTEENVGTEETDETEGNVVTEENTDCEESKVTKMSGENVEIEQKQKNQKKQRKQRKQKEKVVVSKFSSSCEHCLKIFKNSKLYNKHTQEQLCYKDNEITYCKICLMTYKNHNEYKTHLFSLEHINKIGCNTIEKINEDNKTQNSNTTIHKLDPYLNENDVKKISSHNLGDSFTFVYEKGNTQTITLKPIKPIEPINPIKPISKNIVNEVSEVSEVQTTLPNIMNGDTNINTNINTDINSVPEPTIRQTKIINFLEKQILQSSLVDSGNNFYKMLDNKLQLEDYKGLQKIVKNLKIIENYKLNYLKTIDNFINYLVKEKTLGHNFFKDKDISQLVINLTS